jgi:3-oxoacyl-[acyl-carrier-protein] synthase II
MFSQFKKPRRVVITGFGCVTPIGIGRQTFWDALTQGESGVRRIEAFDVSDSPVKIAAEVRGFDWEAQLNPKDRKHVPRTVPLALAAAREAIEDSALNTEDFSLEERRTVGAVLAMLLGGDLFGR